MVGVDGDVSITNRAVGYERAATPVAGTLPAVNPGQSARKSQYSSGFRQQVFGRWRARNGRMGHPDQTTPVDEAAPQPGPPSSGGGRLARPRRALDRAARSGLLAALAGVAALGRAALAFRRGRRVRAVGRGLLAGGWLAAALAQRRARRRGRGTSDPRPVAPSGTTGVGESGGSTAAGGDELTGRDGPPGQTGGAGDRQGSSDPDRSDVVGQDVEPAELGGMTDQPEESGDDHDHGATSSPPSEPDGTVDDE